MFKYIFWSVLNHIKVEIHCNSVFRCASLTLQTPYIIDLLFLLVIEVPFSFSRISERHHDCRLRFDSLRTSERSYSVQNVIILWVHKVNVDISVRSTNFATVFVHRAANVIYHLGSLNIISGILAGSTTNRTGTEQGTQSLITRSVTLTDIHTSFHTTVIYKHNITLYSYT